MAREVLDKRRVEPSRTFRDGGDGHQSPGGPVSSQTLSHRVSLALVAVFIATTVACKSGNPEDMPLQPVVSSGDSAAIANEGKSMEDLFAGKFPGVTVIRADNGGLLIRIRGGSNTFYGSNEPRYVWMTPHWHRARAVLSSSIRRT